MSSPVALDVTQPMRSAGRLAPVRGPRVASQLAGQEGLEPPTAGFGDRDSSQLSYCPMPCCPAVPLRAGSAGTLARPDGRPPDVEVYVAERPRVEPRGSCQPALRPCQATPRSR